MLEPTPSPIESERSAGAQSSGGELPIPESLESALAERPQDHDLRYRYALSLLAANKPKPAIAQLRTLRASIGDDPALLINLGAGLTQCGELPEAITILRSLAETSPDNAEVKFRLGEALRAADQLPDALSAYEAAVEADPSHYPAVTAASNLALGQDMLSTAATLALRACELRPDDPTSWYNRGMVQRRFGEGEVAAAAFSMALRLSPIDLGTATQLAQLDQQRLGPGEALALWQARSEADPEDLGALLVLALILHSKGLKDEALDQLSVIEAFLGPENPDALRELAGAYDTLSEHARALPLYRQARELAPEDFETLRGLATCLRKQALYAQCIEVCEEALALMPGKLEIQLQMAFAQQHLGRHKDATAFYRWLKDQKASPALLGSAIAPLPYDLEVTPTEIVEFAQLVERKAAVPPLTVVSNDRRPSRRLRIGLLSGSFGAHPVGWLTLAAFEALSPEEFSIHVYSTRRRHCELNKRFRLIAESWQEYTAGQEQLICEDMRASEIDILIDLGGYGDGGTPGVLLRKPAPVVVKWVGGQSASTGLSTVDWMLTDHIETPEGFEKYYIERLLRLPDGYVCYTPPPDVPEAGPLPADQNGYVTFGCFNNICKVNDETLQLWSRVLQRVPKSRMILKTRSFDEEKARDIFLERARSFGITAERLELRGSSSHPEMMAQYADMDIALDPIPYTGGLTALESLYMGVPVVCVPFQTFASRHSATHMTNVGLNDWVAHDGDLDHYVEVAVHKASRLEELAELRAGLRQRLLASPLCDAESFGQNLGRALRHVWHDWCDRMEDQIRDVTLTRELEAVENSETPLTEYLIRPAQLHRVRQRLATSHALFPDRKPNGEEAGLLRNDPVLESEIDFEFNIFTMEAGPLALLKALLKRQRPETVVEFGSGISTAVLSRHLSEILPGPDRLQYITIDQSPDYLRESVSRAERFVPGQIMGRHFPIGNVTVDDWEGRSYAIADEDWEEMLDGRGVDFVIIDGPVSGGPTGVVDGRFPTVPMIRRYASPGALFTLDDAFRDGEISIAQKWARVEGVELLGYFPIGKGVLVGRFN